MRHETRLRSATKEVVIGHDRPFCLIGERINPTGRKIFQEQLRAGDLSAIERDVAAQVAGGADVLDVNMGVPLTDEPELLRKAILLVQSLSRPADLHRLVGHRGTRRRPRDGTRGGGTGHLGDRRGRPAWPRSFRCVKRHDAAIIGPAKRRGRDPDGSRQRLELTRKIVRVATQEYCIAIEDIVIDPLAMPIGADTLGRRHLRWTAISRVRAEFGMQP
jgi:5-methyltetrahydrofolate--homocysteine methyltransferase